MAKQRKKTKTIKKNKKKIKCIDCNKRTDDYYAHSINSGVVHRCVECHEKWIIRSVRYDTRFANIEDK